MLYRFYRPKIDNRSWFSRNFDDGGQDIVENAKTMTAWENQEAFEFELVFAW